MDVVVKTVILSLSLTFVAGDKLIYGFDQNMLESSDVGKHWAVIVAGSNGWYNYRHQADACHAYQVLIQHGFSPDRIITMMYDDIAQNEQNPTPGIIINHPNGTDVYQGVKIDYRKEDVTPDVFLAVLKGDADSVSGKGTGRVLQSTGSDRVFVNFVDHGAPGILAFPSEMLNSDDLMDAIQYMHTNNMYKEMVFYVEACESGSMFENLLPTDINVYATTAANAHESSYACYMDEKRMTYLGDVYSVKWMEDSDVENLQTETLHRQYQIVKKETNTSHVMQFGDMGIAKEDVGEFQAGADYKQPITRRLPNAPLNAVKSEDVPLAILKYKLARANSVEEEQRYLHHLQWLQQTRSHVDSLMSDIVSIATKSSSVSRDELMAARHALIDTGCYKTAVRHFADQCVRIPQNDYALRRLYLLVNLCEEKIPSATISAAITTACAHVPYL